MLHSVKDLLAIYEDMVEILLVLKLFLEEDPEMVCLFCDAPFRSEISLLFCNEFFSLWLESVYDDLGEETIPFRFKNCQMVQSLEATNGS